MGAVFIWAKIGRLTTNKGSFPEHEYRNIYRLIFIQTRYSVLGFQFLASSLCTPLKFGSNASAQTIRVGLQNLRGGVGVIFSLCNLARKTKDILGY